mmetsp:Transcript_13653/g.23975  ORF Transcript_13653/g.23975 Transcript_13653/m.23975 type:complete len:157 (-) Transcript_13653:226-696(-)
MVDNSAAAMVACSGRERELHCGDVDDVAAVEVEIVEVVVGRVMAGVVGANANVDGHDERRAVVVNRMVDADFIFLFVLDDGNGDWRVLDGIDENGIRGRGRVVVAMRMRRREHYQYQETIAQWIFRGEEILWNHPPHGWMEKWSIRVLEWYLNWRF